MAVGVNVVDNVVVGDDVVTHMIRKKKKIVMTQARMSMNRFLVNLAFLWSPLDWTVECHLQ